MRQARGMGEFDTLTAEQFHQLDFEGYVVIDGIERTEDADAVRGAIRKVARQQGWRIATRYRPDLGRVWAAREDIKFQTDLHKHAAEVIAAVVRGDIQA